MSKSKGLLSQTQGTQGLRTQGTQGLMVSGSEGSQGSQWFSKEHREHNGSPQRKISPLLWEAVRDALVERVEPGDYRQRSALFDFIRAIKGHRQLCDLPAGKAFEIATDALASLDQANKLDPWMHWFELEPDEAEVLFCSTWDDVKYLPGDGPLETALHRAKQQSVMVRGEMPVPPLYAKFIALIYHAQVLRGEKPVALGVRKVAGVLMGSDGKKDIIAALIHRAAKDGLLVLAKAHRYDGSRREAAEYRVNLEEMEVTL